MCKLTLIVDVFYVAKARRAILARPALSEILFLDYADEWSYKAENSFDANNVREMIIEQFNEYGIPGWEYEVKIA